MLYFLKKNNVRLTSKGEIDYGKIEPQIQHVVKKQEQLVKLVLMQQDLEFEYPHKFERIKVRADLLKWLDEEEERVKRNLEEGAGILQLDEDALSGKVAKTVDLMAGYVLSYEDYYELDDFVGVAKKARQGDGKMPFEEFAKKMASPNIFDNDLLEQQYKFWESAEDREARLKLIWIDLKRKNALGGLDAVSKDE